MCGVGTWHLVGGTGMGWGGTNPQLLESGDTAEPCSCSPCSPLGCGSSWGGGEIPPLGVFPAWINPCGAGLQQHRVQGQAPAPSRWGKVCAFPGRGGAAGFEPPPSPCQPLNVSWVPLNPPVGDDSGCWAEPCQTHRMHQQCPGRHWGGGKGFFLGGKGVLCSRRGQGRAGVGATRVNLM